MRNGSRVVRVQANPPQRAHSHEAGPVFDPEAQTRREQQRRPGSPTKNPVRPRPDDRTPHSPTTTRRGSNNTALNQDPPPAPRAPAPQTTHLPGNPCPGQASTQPAAPTTRSRRPRPHQPARTTPTPHQDKMALNRTDPPGAGRERWMTPQKTTPDPFLSTPFSLQYT